MLWLYMDAAGNITCQVNVGNRIRQGNPFEVFLVIEGMQNDPMTNPFGLQGIAYLPSGGNQFHEVGVVMEGISVETFVLDDPSKATFQFRAGVAYKGYKASIPIGATTFSANGGHCYLLFRVEDGNHTEYATRFSFYVEPSFGKTPSLLTVDDFATITALLETVSTGEFVVTGSFLNYDQALQAIRNVVWGDSTYDMKTMKAEWNDGVDKGIVTVFAWNADVTRMIGAIRGTYWSADFAYFVKDEIAWDVSPLEFEFVQRVANSFSSDHDYALYGIDDSGNQTTIRASSQHRNQNSVPMYDASSNIKTGSNPTDDYDCVNKKYFEDNTPKATDGDIDAMF